MDPYCYPGTYVLINKFDIRDPEQLHVIERGITNRKSAELLRRGIDAPFDFNCLKSIHKYLFENIYPFAGQIRNVDISKGNLFCKAIYIHEQANFIFRKLHKENYLTGLDKKTFIDKLVDYMADINALHPFREGNGRTQRIFFQAFAKNAGYHLCFKDIDKEAFLQADIEAINGKTDKLKSLLYEICSEIPTTLKDKIKSGQYTKEDVEQFNQAQVEHLKKSLTKCKKATCNSIDEQELSR